LENSIVKPYHQISNQLELKIFHDASIPISETMIARLNHISHSTINKKINKAYDEKKTNYDSLPEVMCFDEFKSTKDADGAMSFIFKDYHKNKVIEIVENRQLPFLTNYFGRYSRKARRSVKYIVIDMYEPYIQLIASMFPLAQIVCDKFHIVQHINRALNQTRIEAMKRHKNYHAKFKRYWKLIVMNESRLNSIYYIWCPSFRYYKTTDGIVRDILDIDEELKVLSKNLNRHRVPKRRTTKRFVRQSI